MHTVGITPNGRAPRCELGRDIRLNFRVQPRAILDWRMVHVPPNRVIGARHHRLVEYMPLAGLAEVGDTSWSKPGETRSRRANVVMDGISADPITVGQLHFSVQCAYMPRKCWHVVNPAVGRMERPRGAHNREESHDTTKFACDGRLRLQPNIPNCRQTLIHRKLRHPIQVQHFRSKI